MVFLSDPDGDPRGVHRRVDGLPPGARIALQPVLGPRSVLLQEGAEHLRAAPAHAPAVPRRADARATSRSCARRSRARHRALAGRRAVRAAAADAGDHARRHPARGVRRRRRAARASGCAARLDDVLVAHGVARAAVAVLLAAAAPASAAPFHRARAPDRRRSCSRRSASAGRAGPRRARRHPLDARRRPATRTASRSTTSELRDQLVTLLLAGHETTATALAWAFDALFRHPEVRARLEASLPDERRLPATRSSTRRCASARPAADVGRRLGEPLRRRRPRAAGGHRRDAGDLAPHRRADLYPDAVRASGPSASSTTRPSTYAWIPFGGGMRRCLGAAFAQFEMRVVLAEVVRAASPRAATHARTRRAPQRHVLARAAGRASSAPARL